MKKRKQNDTASDAAQPLSTHSLSFPTSSPDSGKSFEGKRPSPIDLLVVDKQSRIILTKKVKRVIPSSPEDKIAVYQDINIKDIVLKV